MCFIEYSNLFPGPPAQWKSLEEVSYHNATSNKTATNVSMINTQARCFQKKKEIGR